MTESIKMKAPSEEIPYPDSGGMGGAYMDSKWSAKISKFEAKVPYPRPHKYTVEILEGFAPDAGTSVVCFTDDLEEAAESYREWSGACPTMVAVHEGWRQVEPYGYG